MEGAGIVMKLLYLKPKKNYRKVKIQMGKEVWIIDTWRELTGSDGYKTGSGLFETGKEYLGLIYRKWISNPKMIYQKPDHLKNENQPGKSVSQKRK